MAAPTKEYGLFVRNSNKSAIQPKLAIFDNDSDDDGHSAVGKSLQREADRIQAKKQVKLNLKSALEEDPTVFEYDEIYDDIAQKKQEQTGWQKRNKEKTPKYIHSLLKAAKTRKLEQERALERKVQKEREAEGEEFAGKEAFVTSAFKKKMQEMEELEEKEKQEARIEALTDVTKQKDLSGFYRHLYKHTLGTKEKQVTEESVASASEIPQEKKSSDDLPSDDAIESTSKHSQRQDESPKRFKDRKPRQFRIRRHSTDSSSESDRGRRVARKKSRDRSHDSSSSSDSAPVATSSSHRSLQEKDKPKKSMSSKRSGSSSSEGSLSHSRYSRSRQSVAHRMTEKKHNSSRTSKTYGDSSSDGSPVRSKYSGSSHSVSDRTLENNRSSKGGRSSRKRRPSNCSTDSDGRHSKRRSVKQSDRSPVKVHTHARGERESHRHREKESSGNSKCERSRDSASQKGGSDRREEKRHSSQSEQQSKTTDTKESGKTAEEIRREKLVALFKKRNVEELFEQARDRYLARKESRMATLTAFGQGS